MWAIGERVLSAFSGVYHLWEIGSGPDENSPRPDRMYHNPDLSSPGASLYYNMHIALGFIEPLTTLKLSIIC